MSMLEHMHELVVQHSKTRIDPTLSSARIEQEIRTVMRTPDMRGVVQKLTDTFFVMPVPERSSIIDSITRALYLKLPDWCKPDGATRLAPPPPADGKLLLSLSPLCESPRSPSKKIYLN